MGWLLSSLAEPGSGVIPGPGDEGADEVFAVGEGVVGAAPLQVFMDRHKGGEPEASGGYPADEGMGLGRGLAVGLGHGRMEAMLLGQPAEPEERPIRGQIFVGGRGRGLSGRSGYPYEVHLMKFTWEFT